MNNSTIYPKDYGKGITLTVLNTQSLNNKAAIFIDFICEYQPDLLAATETWFIDGESASKTQCTPGGYRFFDHSRSGRRGGGTGLLFKNNLMVTKVTGGEHQSFEYLEWKVTSGSRRVNLIIMYRPPYSAAHPVTSAVFFVEFAEYLESIVLSADPLLIVGDFNIHIDSNENYDAIKLSELLQSFSLTQHVQVPTHSSGHTLDLIITRKTDDLVSSVPRAGCLFSDHMPVFCELDMGKVHFTKSNVSYRNLSAINLDALRADLSNSDLCKNTDLSDIHELAKSYNETLESVINRHAPLRTKTIVARPHVPWFNNEVKSVKRERRRAERKWRRTRQLCDFQIYKSKKNYMIFVMNRSRKKYYTDFVLEHGSDQRKLFNAAKSLFNQRNDLNFPAYDDQTMLANDIGEFFVQKVENIRNELDLSASDLHNRVFDELVALNASFDSFKQLDEEDVKDLIAKSNRKTSSFDPMPTSIVVQCQDILLPVLTRMINMSLNSGVFPAEWKVADVRPLAKKSNLDTCTAFENLRPVSNLSYVSKLIERTVFNQTNNFLNTQGLYPQGQSAYRKCHSTETALLRVTNDIMMNMNRQHVTLLVMLDLSSAFDTIDHGVLLDRLNNEFGIKGRVLEWFTSYLSKRSQFISINGGRSRLFNVSYGVPQGSCLGPLLFVLYVSKLFRIVEKHLPDAHAFADDSQLYVSFKPDSTCDQLAAVAALEHCIDDIKDWMLSDKLKVNDGKTEFLIIGTRQQLAKVNFNSLRIGDNSISSVDKAKNLGFWFDSKMTMVTNISKCSSAAFFNIFNIRRIRKFLTYETAKILVNSLVLSRLDYCNSLLYGLPTVHLNKLQRVQNAAARLISNTSRFDHITPTLINLHWLPVKYRIDFKLLLIVFKALHGQAPDYLIELIKIKSPCNYNIRSNREFLLEQPSVKTLVTLGDRSFTSAAPVLWNSLPSYIREANSVDSFKRLLKTYLFRKAYSV